MSTVNLSSIATHRIWIVLYIDNAWTIFRMIVLVARCFLMVAIEGRL